MKKKPQPDAWYVEDGPETDVVLSSRVRLARNLEGFAFPLAIKLDDAERVQSIVFDAFNHMDNPERYQAIRVSGMDASGKRILSERGVIDPDCGMEPWRGVVIRDDGVVSVAVNMEDHVRIAAFAPGHSLLSSLNEAAAIEKKLGESMRFSTLPGFGYLASSLMDTGSGLKASVLMCLSGLCMNGLLERVIREYLGQGFSIRGYYGQRDGVSLGCLYQISNLSAAAGDAETQISLLDQAATKLVELERRCRTEIMGARATVVEDSVFRAIVTAKYARFITFAEAVDLLQRIRLGVNLSLITGVSNPELTALLYRIQNGHINFIIQGGSIIIEDDIKAEEMRMDRLRAMVIQEVLKEADIRERR